MVSTGQRGERPLSLKTLRAFYPFRAQEMVLAMRVWSMSRILQESMHLGNRGRVGHPLQGLLTI